MVALNLLGEILNMQHCGSQSFNALFCQLYAFFHKRRKGFRTLLGGDSAHFTGGHTHIRAKHDDIQRLKLTICVILAAAALVDHRRLEQVNFIIVAQCARADFCDLRNL